MYNYHKYVSVPEWNLSVYKHYRSKMSFHPKMNYPSPSTNDKISIPAPTPPSTATSPTSPCSSTNPPWKDWRHCFEGRCIFSRRRDQTEYQRHNCRLYSAHITGGGKHSSCHQYTSEQNSVTSKKISCITLFEKALPRLFIWSTFHTTIFVQNCSDTFCLMSVLQILLMPWLHLFEPYSNGAISRSSL